MAAEERALLTLSIFVSILYFVSGEAKCTIPDHVGGDYYTLQGSSSTAGVGGQDRFTNINDKKFISDKVDGECYEVQEFREQNNSKDTTKPPDVKLLVFDQKRNCYACNIILYRTKNILQTKETGCISASNPTIANTCNEGAALITLFRKDLKIVNCKGTFEGVWHFSYEITEEGSGSICDNAKSNIIACQEPGSPYVDNQVFDMIYSYCPGIKSSKDQSIRYQCMGTWVDDATKNVYSAVADLGQEIWKNKFRCFLTRLDQQTQDTTVRYTMSRTADCSVLLSEFDGPVKLVLKPVASYAQLNEISPTCNLPESFTGTWFTSVERDSFVTINATHIYFKTQLDQYNIEELYYTCKQNSDNRYLMSAITVGKCEIDYICFEFQERHHNIIRYRMGKPYRLTKEEKLGKNFMYRKYAEACSHQAFTHDQSNRQWMYSTLILHPPAPVECPIAGKYTFVQKSDNSNNLYRTRIRGITEKPRVQVDCRHNESEIQVCRKNPNRISLDVQRCATVDQNGAPIGEYDVADNYLQCVGFWYENMKSVLITYDEEDSVSPYRCWVFERENLRYIKMSRSLRSACDSRQTTSSSSSREGASLSLTLTENEREFDDCPQRYDTGIDPYKKLQSIYIVGSKNSGVAAVYSTLTSFFCFNLALFL